jgi:hypothetical protein
MDGCLACFCELTYRIDPVSEYLDVVNSCHISQFYLLFLSFQGASNPYMS